jgi:hypothetical protein
MKAAIANSNELKTVLFKLEIVIARIAERAAVTETAA